MRKNIAATSLLLSVFVPMFLWTAGVEWMGFENTQFISNLVTVIISIGMFIVVPYCIYLLTREFSLKNRLASLALAVTLYAPMFTLYYGNHLGFSDTHPMWDVSAALLAIGLLLAAPFAAVQLYRLK